MEVSSQHPNLATGTLAGDVFITEGPDPYAGLLKAASILKVVSCYLTLMVASVGNGLSLAVMCRPSMRGTSSTFYLAAIAVADTATVYFGQLPPVFAYHGWSAVTEANEWTCGMWLFWLFTTSDVAVWLVLALTVDRFVAVWLPHHAKRLCSVRRAAAVSAGLVLLALLKNFIIPVSSSPDLDPATGESQCVMRDDLQHFMFFIRPWIAFTMYAFVPIFLVFVLNVLIIYRLFKVKAAAGAQVAPLPASTSGPTQKQRVLSSMNAMFLSVSVVFLVLLTPAILHYATVAYWVDSRADAATAAMLTAAFELLSYSNHSINFFLYCLTGRRFRREFLALVGFKPKSQADDSSRLSQTNAS